MNGSRRDDARSSPTASGIMVRDQRMLASAQEMGRLMQTHDWSASGLGDYERWPEALRTTLSTCLGSRFPMLVFWGPDDLMLYNDAYRVILGNKHPHAFGRPCREVWSEIWPIIGPMLDGVRERGTATWSENQHLLVERHGFVEDAYFTFSYGPIRDESGAVGGILTVVAETTGQVLDARRLRTLQELASHGIGTTRVRDACERALAVLAQNPYDLPFALLYLPDGTSRAVRAGQAGSVATAAWCSEQVALDAPSAAWPLRAVADCQRSELVEHLEQRFGQLALEPGRPVPRTALVLPVMRTGSNTLTAWLVVGVSPRLALDAKYSGFLELVARSLAASLGSAEAHEDESRRAETLAELDRAKTAFFNNVSHELRTPLTLLLAPLEDSLSCVREPLPERQRERIELARRNGKRLQKLVNTLLDFARIEAGRARVSLEPTDLATFTRDIASSFDALMANAGLTLVLDCQELSRAVQVDRAMWEKILLNLLSNAYKFTLEGEVAVSLRELGDDLELRVRDTGIGIAAPEQARVFERFYRVADARGRSHEGTGIGLALVRDLVELHGGSVQLSSALGGGSEFVVRMPVTGDPSVLERWTPLPSSVPDPSSWLDEAALWDDIELPSTSSRTWHARAAFSTTPPHPGARVLIADDNADMRGYLSQLLSPFWSVECVGDGAQALASVRAAPPDLVICDVMMPGMDGLRFVRALRGDERTSTVPVMLLSARAGEEATIDGLASGADEYLVKPFSTNELIARVNAQLTVSALRKQAVNSVRAHAEEADRLLADARRATQLREETLAVVSHDLRTPLTGIKMCTDLLLLTLGEGDRDRHQRKQIDSIRRSAARMDRLIGDLLDLASIDAGKLSLQPRGHTVEELLRDVQDAFALRAEQKGLQLVAEAEPGLPVLEADKERLLQVLGNLLANALQFTPQGGQVRVRASSRPPGVLFSVSDTGIGIAPEQLPHVFDRYWHASNEGRAGHGLGLSIATGIVEAHGGNFEVESEPGRGSTFSFFVPTAQRAIGL